MRIPHRWIWRAAIFIVVLTLLISDHRSSRKLSRAQAASPPAVPVVTTVAIATSLFMAAIRLAGAAGYRQLPVSALPQVDYATIQVVTFYPGASPDVMASSVTAPLERQFGQVPGLNQIRLNLSEPSS